MFNEDEYVSRRKKISLEQFDELYHSNKRCLDLQNLDLSGLDLSSYIIGKDVEYFHINNVNFENTNITILLDTEYSSGISNSNLKSAKFMKIGATFDNVVLDNSGVKQLNELLKYYFRNENVFIYDIFDLYTLLNNPKLKLPFDVIMRSLSYSKIKHSFSGVLTKEKIKELEHIIDVIIGMNKTIRNFYNNIKDDLNYADKVRFFFFGKLNKITLKNMTIDKDMWHMFITLSIRECNCENVVFDLDAKELNCNPFEFANMNVHNITMPKLKYSDYDKINVGRVVTSPITFKKNLYLELGRSCNALCSFCRNKCMSESNYNYKKITQSLGTIIGNVDSIVIGGGEPTLKRSDLINLLENFRWLINKIYIFSNGIETIKFHNALNFEQRQAISYYISRHSIDDEINARILGVNPEIVSSVESLGLNCRNINLSCTCVNGGTDTPDKIINYIVKYKYHNVMFCNLMNDASVNMDITYNNDMGVDSSIFDETISYLRKQGYDYHYEIVSTAGYILYILKNKYNNGKNIVFKKYISKKELDEKWPTAIKRTFDLSIAPNGSIYENWSQLEQKTKKKRR